MSDEQLNTIVECCECEWTARVEKLAFSNYQYEYTCHECGGCHVIEVDC